MATFLGIHDMGSGMPEEQIKASWASYKEACEKLGCKSLHVHYNADKGRAFCLTEASSAEEIQKAHDSAQVPLVEILEVSSMS